MMYKQDFVAVIKNDGKILRENKDMVLIPFGCEYSILMKNLRAQKAVVRISVDGQDVLNGHELIVNANSELELERFLENNMCGGNRFKFIQKTEKIQEHRGDKIDDGIVRIEFQFEKPRPTYYPDLWTTTWTTPINLSSSGVYYKNSLTGTGYARGLNDSSIGGSLTSSDVTSGTSTDTGSFTSTSTNYNISSDVLRSTTCDSFSASNNISTSNISTSSISTSSISLPQVDEGITVKGSESSQRFVTGHVGQLENEVHVITLQLKGFKDNGAPVQEAVTVKTKKVCNTCGTKNESSAKYCKECGTYLE